MFLRLLFFASIFRVSWGIGKLFELFSGSSDLTNHFCLSFSSFFLGMFYLRSRPCHPIFVKLSSFIDRPTSWAGQAWPFLGLWPCLKMKWAWEVGIMLLFCTKTTIHASLSNTSLYTAQLYDVWYYLELYFFSYERFRTNEPLPITYAHISLYL